MFGISGEHLLVLLVILLIFGPKRLPDLGHSIGRTLKNFRDGMAGNGGTSQQGPIIPQPQSKPQAEPQITAPTLAQESSETKTESSPAQNVKT
jgi:sec-independent protein translocase protein TatA